MKTNILTSIHNKTDDAISECISKANINSPELILTYTTEQHDLSVIQSRLKEKFPHAQIAGSTTCLGVMTNQGSISDNAHSCAVILFECSEGEELGVGIQEYGQNTEAAKLALTESRNKMAEDPKFIWFISTPGPEEESIFEIEKSFEQHIPIYGGSAADNSISGNWKIYKEDKVISDGLLLISFYSKSSQSPKSTFSSAYNPTGTFGIITKASKRRIEEIDHKPAMSVYNQWAETDLTTKDDDLNILANSTLFPLGRELTDASNDPFFVLSHPESTSKDGSMAIFTDINVGDKVHLLSGTSRMLKNSVATMLKEYMRENMISLDSISSVLIVYCAGCMLEIEEEGINSMTERINAVLENVPYIGVFTFGEQGSYLTKKNLHGNLMFSATFIYK